MSEESAQRARKEAMRQIKRKQSQLLSSDAGGGRWRLDVGVPALVVQALACMVVGVLMGAGLHILLSVFFA